jgi:hypothetical protein
MMTTFTIVNVDYVMYEHFMLWMQWLRIFTYDAIGYSIYICDVPHHLMMFDCWIYKLYYAMHRWNMTIQKKYHPIFNSLSINIMSWIGKFYGFFYVVDIIRLLLILKIKKRQPLHVHLVHMYTGECPLVCVMNSQLFKDTWGVYFLTMLKE